MSVLGACSLWVLGEEPPPRGAPGHPVAGRTLGVSMGGGLAPGPLVWGQS